MASFKVEWKQSAIKELKNLEKQVILRILQAVEELAEDPHSPASRKMRGAQHTCIGFVWGIIELFTLYNQRD